MKRNFLSLLLGFVTAIALACGGSGAGPKQTTATPGSQFPVIVQESDGTSLTLSSRPQRIVSLAAHATEIFCAVGADSQLVAVERYANCPPSSSAKPALDSFRPNLEAIAAYKPDLVYVSSNRGGLVDSLRRLDIPVLYIELPASLDGVLDHILTLGRATGHEAEAKALTDSMRSRMDAVKKKIADAGQGPRIYHELTTEYFSAAPNSFVGDFYSFLKAQNIAAGAATQYPQLSAEVIIQRNPEVIVLADEAAGVDAASVRSRPGWGAIDAVKNNRICVIDPDIVSRPGPRIVDALDALGKCLYPQRFQ